MQSLNTLQPRAAVRQASGRTSPRASKSAVVAQASITSAPHAVTPQKFTLASGVAIPVPADIAPLFQSLLVGHMDLSNRIVYAPLTRCRAVTDNVINASAAQYYSQRATPGTLLISEATNISQEARGVPNTPGIWSPAQVEGWKPVVAAVKANGSYMFCQLWHTGRASDEEYQPGNVPPLSSSAVGIKSPEWVVFTEARGWGPYQAVPRAATLEDIQRVVGEYAAAARNALAAGFDGVEIHGANGYLIDQFIKDSINQRTDDYGGSIENRCRFCLQVVDAVVAACDGDAKKVGIRITPFTTFNDALDSTPYATHTYLAEKLRAKGLAYLHMVEPRVVGIVDADSTLDSLAPFRQAYHGGVFISAGGFTREAGAAAVASGATDLVAYGRLWLANPDFHKRILLNAPFNKYDRDTFYASGLEGYLDYPTLD